jgi:hypothetical protein
MVFAWFLFPSLMPFDPFHAQSGDTINKNLRAIVAGLWTVGYSMSSYSHLTLVTLATGETSHSQDTNIKVISMLMWGLSQ